MQNQEPKWSAGMIILDRLRLVGEDVIPVEEFENLSQRDWITYLTEKNPDKFPPHMEHLKKYLMYDEEEE